MNLEGHPPGDQVDADRPEPRTYRFQLGDGDNPVGDTSDEVSVVPLPLGG